MYRTPKSENNEAWQPEGADGGDRLYSVSKPYEQQDDVNSLRGSLLSSMNLHY